MTNNPRTVMDGEDGGPKDLLIRRCDEADVAAVSNLVTRCTPGLQGGTALRAMGPEYYRWMYFGNPVGRAVVFGAFHAGELVSSFALAPKRLRAHGVDVVVGKTMDMFTLKEHRGLGLMSRLAERVFTIGRSSGMPWWYVTPSANSYPIFRHKWGYVEPLSLFELSRVIDPVAVARAYRRGKGRSGRERSDDPGGVGVLERSHPRAARGFEVEQIHRFDATTDAVWEEVARNAQYVLCRDAEYMTWRYLEHPDQYYCLAFRKNRYLRGLLVFRFTVRRGLKCGEVLDFLFVDNDRRLLRVMLRYAVETFRSQGCALARTWVIAGADEMRDSLFAGFWVPRRVRLLFTPNIAGTDVGSGASWFLTQGDGNDV